MTNSAQHWRGSLWRGQPRSMRVRTEGISKGGIDWLRVLRSAEAARIGPGVWQQRHTRAVRSEKCMRLRGRTWAGMRVIAVFFGPCAPDVLTAHGSVFSYDFKRLDRFTKLATSSLVVKANELLHIGERLARIVHQGAIMEPQEEPLQL